MSPQQTLDELESRRVMASPLDLMSVPVAAPVPGPEHSVAQQSSWMAELDSLTVYRIILHLLTLFLIIAKSASWSSSDFYSGSKLRNLT